MKLLVTRLARELVAEVVETEMDEGIVVAGQQVEEAAELSVRPFTQLQSRPSIRQEATTLHQTPLRLAYRGYLQNGYRGF